VARGAGAVEPDGSEQVYRMKARRRGGRRHRNA
jgi:hypothetical protein